jgi:Flp pilus assembly protein TadG
MSAILATRRREQRTGAAAVEFAVAISVLLMIVFASIEFVRLSMLRHSVTHASYLAARRGIIIGATANEARQVALDHLDVFGLSGAAVTVTPSDITDQTEFIEVNVSVPVTGNSWISPVYFNGSLAGRTRILAEREAADMNRAVVQSPP